MTEMLDKASWHSEALTRALVARKDCDVLAELIVLRDKGDNSDNIHQYFENRRHQGIRYSDSTSFVELHHNVLQDLDHAIHFVRTKRFLELGCAPGGYSTYILNTNPEATGIGITLPAEDGAPDIYISPELLNCIDVHRADLMDYDLAPSVLKENTQAQTLTPLPVEPVSMDLVICDARWVKFANNPQRAWNWTRLLISQLLIALRTVTPGGTVLLRLSQPEKMLSGRILLALCRVANFVQCIKPRRFQATRSWFYVLARQVNRDSEDMAKLEQALERLWYTMTFEGDEGHGRDLTEDDEATITSKEELMSEEGLAKIVRLGTPVWEAQHASLFGFLTDKGVI